MPENRTSLTSEYWAIYNRVFNLPTTYGLIQPMLFGESLNPQDPQHVAMAFYYEGVEAGKKAMMEKMVEVSTIHVGRKGRKW